MLRSMRVRRGVRSSNDSSDRSSGTVCSTATVDRAGALRTRSGAVPDAAGGVPQPVRQTAIFVFP